MTKIRKHTNTRPSRLDRIEKKCNRILSELLIIRQLHSRTPDSIDCAIERMHRAARNLQVQCEHERARTARMFNSKSDE
ncbi:hypothetical protein [uncultured Duncaniella sp.]|uniref:hypothetical protein n=1 Tax=uncultured Duncaniella sp. TaxID=2768039 RepID=UPI00272A41C8|nr:hypothetical protein [uncultured Duncaniella sp.]